MIKKDKIEIKETKHCIFKNYTVLMLFVNCVVLTLDKMKKEKNFILDKLNNDIETYSNLVEEYFQHLKQYEEVKTPPQKNFVAGLNQEDYWLFQLKDVFNSEKSYLMLDNNSINHFEKESFKLSGIDLNEFKINLKLTLNENQYFKETYLFKYVDYINSLNHSDIEDLIFPHEKFKEFIKDNPPINIISLKLNLIIITINLLRNLDLKKDEDINIFQHSKDFNNAIRNTNLLAIEKAYENEFKQKITLKKINYRIIVQFENSNENEDVFEIHREPILKHLKNFK